MDFSPEGLQVGGDFSRQGSKLIVNFQGPFYQRGPNDGPQQKNAPSAVVQTLSDHEKYDEMQVTATATTTTGTKGVRSNPGNSFGNDFGPSKVVESSYNRSKDENNSYRADRRSERTDRTDRTEQSVVVPKHPVGEVEEEEEEDDGEVDLSATVSSSEQTGRWTRKEHEVFLEALKKFGKVLNPYHYCPRYCFLLAVLDVVVVLVIVFI